MLDKEVKKKKGKKTKAFFILETPRDQGTSGTWVCVFWRQVQGPEKQANIDKYVLEAGFDVLPAVPGHRATSQD